MSLLLVVTAISLTGSVKAAAPPAHDLVPGHPHQPRVRPVHEHPPPPRAPAPAEDAPQVRAVVHRPPEFIPELVAVRTAALGWVAWGGSGRGVGGSDGLGGGAGIRAEGLRGNDVGKFISMS
jgi:hypothetical protein